MEEHNMWEPPSNLNNAQEVMELFHKKHPSAPRNIHTLQHLWFRPINNLTQTPEGLSSALHHNDEWSRTIINMRYHNGHHNRSAVHSAHSLWLSMDVEHMKNGMEQSFRVGMNAKEGVVSWERFFTYQCTISYLSQPLSSYTWYPHGSSTTSLAACMTS